MSVHTLWSELLDGGWQQLSLWRANAKTEGLHLDFKQGAFVNGDIRPDDRKNLAKSLSGFANVEGGLLVFGAETTRGPSKQDVLKALTCVEPLDQYAERVRLYVKDYTTPSIPGVEVREFDNPSKSKSGIVVVRIPVTNGVPYRAEGPNPEVSGKYFMRTTSDTVVMPHQVLAAMFGRRPAAQLRVGVEFREGARVVVHVKNVGRGAAIAAFVRLRLNGQNPDSFSAIGGWQDRHAGLLGWNVGYGLPAGELIYPEEARMVGSFRHGGDEKEIAVRIDCENGQPIEDVRQVKLQPGTIEWFGTPSDY